MVSGRSVSNRNEPSTLVQRSPLVTVLVERSVPIPRLGCLVMAFSSRSRAIPKESGPGASVVMSHRTPASHRGADTPHDHHEYAAAVAWIAARPSRRVTIPRCVTRDLLGPCRTYPKPPCDFRTPCACAPPWKSRRHEAVGKWTRCVQLAAIGTNYRLRSLHVVGTELHTTQDPVDVVPGRPLSASAYQWIKRDRAEPLDGVRTKSRLRTPRNHPAKGLSAKRWIWSGLTG